MPVYPKPLPPSPRATPQPFKWLLPPTAGQGLLQIGQSVYLVTECHFTEDDGRTTFCVRLRRQGAEMTYQLCQDRDNLVVCDCPDSVYRGRQCKHATAIVDAYASLDRERRLSDFLDDATAELDAILADQPPAVAGTIHPTPPTAA